MLTPDYQEFPNRPGLATRDNTVIFRPGASAEMQKSAPRCAITTSPDERQSGTLPLFRLQPVLASRIYRDARPGKANQV
jgi:hypothetical protein